MTVYRPQDVAERWQCSERHVRNEIRAGRLRAFRLGGRLLRVRHADVEAYECGSSCSEGNGTPCVNGAGGT